MCQRTLFWIIDNLLVLGLFLRLLRVISILHFT